jgi:hypothetical protein
VGDLDKKLKTIPLSGKFTTAEPATIGTNFSTLTNMRYTDTHPKSIAGNTKINTTALTTYLKARNAFHFRKVQPAESHLIAQVYNTGITASQLLQNTTAIPIAGDFSATAIWTDSTGASRGYFCNAPDGQLIYCNGVDTCIWGGNEIQVSAFITSTASTGDDGAVTNPKDCTDAMQNTKTDGDNIAYIGGGYDTYTKLLWNCNGADADVGNQTASTGQTVTTVANACLDTAYKKFGTASLLLDGTGDYCTVPDSTDWYFAAAPFTIDLWFKPNGNGSYPFTGQYVDGNNLWEFYGVLATTLKLYFYIKSTTVKASYAITTGVSINANNFNHVELVRNGTSVYMFVNGVSQSLTVTTAIAANEVPNLSAVLQIGTTEDSSVSMNGWIDEFRISKGVARHTANFSVPTYPYLPNANYFLVGSPRPLQGIKLYVNSGNSIASTMTGYEWNGSSWSTLSLTDNTDTGASLAVTGTVTFSSTITTSKARFVEGYFLYWYKFYVDAGEATIYKVTLDAPFQSIIDLWDGQYRDISSAYKMGATSREDIATKVLKDDYDTTDAETYVDIGSMAAYPTSYFELGFNERMTGLHFRLASDYTNGDNATVMSVDYWNGTDYVTVGAVSDGTTETGGTKSFFKSGTVTWNNAEIGDETKTNKMETATIWSPLSDTSTTESVWGNLTVKGQYVSNPLYFYRVRFSNALDATVRLNYVGGITSEKDMSYFKFPIFAQGRILLCGDMSGKKNKVTCSGKYTPQAYNGTDSVDIFIGDEGELTCGTELFSQYGGNLYSLVLFFKDTELWIIAGQDISTWSDSIYPVSTTIGCPSPQTLKTITLSSEPAAGLNRSLAIWQGANGIYMSDGRAPIPIHGDIKEYFDKNNSLCINASMVGDSVSFMDNDKQEYHWLFSSGTSATTLNTELAYDIIRNKWFFVDRGTGMDLQCGVDVQDTYGNQYTYGFIDTGYMERLEYGNTFDGNSNTATMKLGDFLPADSIMLETMLDKIKLITVAKTTTTNTITATHYGDTATTGTTLKSGAFAPQKTGYRIAQPFVTDNLGRYTFHSLEFSQTTTNETVPFEPIALGLKYHVMSD